MKKVKIIYTRRELLYFAKSAVLSLVTGLLRILWAIILLVINLAIWCVSELAAVIRKQPVVAFVVALVVSGVIYAVAYMRMKYRLTTAEWERDSLELKMDSIKVLYGDKVGYYRYQSYKEE